jgi:hypothetical protein
MQLQQPNIVGNFLNAYQSGLERQEAQKEAERQRLRQDRADQRTEQQFQWQMDDRQLQDAMRRKDLLARAALGLKTPEQWAAGAPKVMRELGMDGEVPGFDQRERIISEAMTIGDQLEQEWKARGYKLDEMRTMAQVRASNANAAQSYAAAAASRRGGGAAKAPAGYMWSLDGSSLVGIPGGPADPAKKLTETQSKDLAFYERGKAALDKLDADRAKNMTSLYNSTIGEAPFGIGNYWQTPSSRQGKQAAADFLAAILRKDSGAALTKSDFDVYGTIFIPQFGDDPGTLQQKAESRTKALEALRVGLGSAEILASAGAPASPPPPALGAPAAQGAVPRAASPQGAPSPRPNIPPPPPGARIIP